MSGDESQEYGFLGEEFLTWIWFRWETEGGEFRLSSDRVVGIALDDLLTFAPGRDGETEQTLRKGLPTTTAEARTALRGGRRLATARLVIAEGQRQWNVTLNASSMTMRSVRLPDDDEEADSAEERTESRIADWMLLQSLLTELYGLFLRERLRPEYLEQTAPKQAQWMTQ